MPIIPIDDLDDSRLGDYRLVPQPARLRREGLFVAESRLVVRELLASQRFETRSLLVTPAALDSLDEPLAGRRDDLPVYVARHQLMEHVVGFDVHRGCLALGHRPVSASGLGLDALRTAPLVLILEDVGNPDNIGGIFRNAAAFGAAAVLLSPHCGDPLYRKAIRVSIGATLRIPFGPIDDWPAGLDRLRAHGFTIVALTPEPQATDIGSWVPPPAARLAVLLGSEGPGLREAAAEMADAGVRIPMASGVDSLNVATAAAIALHHWTSAGRVPES